MSWAFCSIVNYHASFLRNRSGILAGLAKTVQSEPLFLLPTWAERDRSLANLDLI